MATRNLLVRAGFDASGMTKGTRQANTALKQFGQNANNSMSSLSTGISASIGKIGKILAAAFAVKAIVNFGKECTQLGSDLEEVQNVVDVTFGDMASSINDFASTAIEQFGLSETSAKKYAGVFGSMSMSMGLSRDAALELSKSVTGLTGDVASFYNISNDEAYTKLKSIWTGETESLKELGVVMTQTNLKQYAMSQGISKNIANMTEAEKVMLRYGYVTKALSNASGDFARNSNSWANQTRILSEQFNALKATIGQGLITALAPVVQYLNILIGKLRVAAGYFKSFMELLFGKQSTSGGAGMIEVADSMSGVTDDADSASDAVGGIGDAAKAAGKKAKGALASFDELNQLSKTDSSSDSGSGVSSSLGNMGGTVGVDLGSVDETAISSKLEGIANTVNELFSKFATISFEPLIASFTRLKESIAPITETLFSGLKWGIDNVIFPLTKWTIESLLPVFLDLLSGAFKILNPLIASFKPLGLFLWNNFLQPIATWTGGVIVSVLKNLAKALTSVGDWMSENIDTVSAITTILAGFFAAWEVTKLLAFIQVSGGIVSALGAITTAIKVGIVAKLADKLQTIALTALYAKDFLVSIVASTAALIKQTAQFVASKVAVIATTVATGAWNAICIIATTVTTAFGAAVAFLTSPVGLVIAAIAALVAGVIILIKNWDTVKVAGANAWTGIKNAWNSASQWFSNTIITPISKAFSTLWNGIKSSASSAFTSIGNSAKQGMNWVIGHINSMISKINSKLSFTLPDFFGGGKVGFSIPSVPKLANGGVLTKSTLIEAGEDGPEAIVPLQNNTEWTGQVASLLANALMPFVGGGGNGGQHVSLEMDGVQIARTITPYILKEMKRLGFEI